MNKHFFKKIVLVGIFIVPFVSLINISSFVFPFVTSKAFLFRILIEILAGAWVMLIIFDKKYRTRWNWLPISICAFLGVITVADIFGINPYTSFWGTFERMDGLINLLHIGAFFFIASSILSTEKLWDRFFNTTIGVSVAVSLYGILQLVAKLPTEIPGRIDSTIGNAGFFATFLLINIFLALYMLIKSEKLNRAYIPIIILHLIALFFTGTRGAVVGLVAGIIVAGVILSLFANNHIEDTPKKLRIISISIISGIIVLIGIFFIIKDQPFIKENPILGRFAAISAQDIQNQNRLKVWAIALTGIKERPILGWGQENFNTVFQNNYQASLYADETRFDRTHNIVLDWLINGGLLGLLAYLAIYAVALFYIWSNRRADSAAKNEPWSITEKSLLTGLLVAYFVNNLFLFDNLTSYILFFTFLAYIYSKTIIHAEEEPITATENINKLSKKKERELEAEKRDLAGTFIIPVAVVVVFLIYYVNANAIMAACDDAQAHAYIPVDATKSLDLYKSALGYGSFGGDEIRRDLIISAIDVGNNREISAQTKRGFFDLGHTEMNTQIQENRLDAYDLYLTGNFLFTYVYFDEALNVFNKAHELSPNRQSILVKISQIYMTKNDYLSALAAAKTAYELEPKDDEARIAYAVTLIYTKDFDDATKLLTERYGTTSVDDPSIVRAYKDTGYQAK